MDWDAELTHLLCIEEQNERVLFNAWIYAFSPHAHTQIKLATPVLLNQGE